jgi:hypothetical protein
MIKKMMKQAKGIFFFQMNKQSFLAQGLLMVKQGISPEANSNMLFGLRG